MVEVFKNIFILVAKSQKAVHKLLAIWSFHPCSHKLDPHRKLDAISPHFEFGLDLSIALTNRFQGNDPLRLLHPGHMSGWVFCFSSGGAQAQDVRVACVNWERPNRQELRPQIYTRALLTLEEEGPSHPATPRHPSHPRWGAKMQVTQSWTLQLSWQPSWMKLKKDLSPCGRDKPSSVRRTKFLASRGNKWLLFKPLSFELLIMQPSQNRSS